MAEDLEIHLTRRTRAAWLARQTLDARQQDRGCVWVGHRSSSASIAAAITLVGVDAPDAAFFRATTTHGAGQVIRWLAPDEEPGPAAMTFAYFTRPVALTRRAHGMSPG